MQIVNGYVCQTSCDVSAARAGHDPKNPHDDPVKAQRLAEQRALAGGRAPDGAIPGPGAAVSAFGAEAVTFGGRLAGPLVSQAGAGEAARLVDRVA